LGISNFDVTAWFGLVAPAATPDPVVQRLNAATGEMLAAPAARDRLLALRAVPKSSSPKELADLIAADISRWTEVVDKAGIERI
jgi:tripartite-type tricarboxylate transporter receptor subunit TctC